LIVDLGTIAYQEAWDLQHRIHEAKQAGLSADVLLLLEHPHVLTLGKNAKKENILVSETVLRDQGIDCVSIERGGDVTYHGPGQLVGYPLLPLSPLMPVVESIPGSQRPPRADYIGYLRKLEEVLILTLHELGLEAIRLEGKTGVWSATGPAKIASIGVRVDGRGVTRHGFALNVSPEMSHWEGIVACGLEGVAMTSLAELINPVPTMAQVSEFLIPTFGAIFEYQMQEV
jgi:lipoate-protein ligase B